MNQKPQVSIAIPLYQKAGTIARTIKSALGQSMPDFEIVVVDDGSTDGGADAVAGFSDSRIRLVRQENRGDGGARNRCLRESRSDLIAFLDADDEYRPDFLETVLELKKRHPDAGMFCTSFEYTRRAASPTFLGVPDPPWEGVIENALQCFLGDLPFYTSSIMVRREVFEKLGGFFENFRLGCDTDMWLRIALNYPIAFTWKKGVIYHQEAENRIAEMSILTSFPNVETAQKAMAREGLSEEDKQLLKEYIARLELRVVMHNLEEGNYQTAREKLKPVAYTRHFRKQWIKLFARAYTPRPLFELYRKIKRRGG